MKTALTCDTLYTPLERIDHPVLIMEQGEIVSMGARNEIAITPAMRHVDLGDAILAPGFIDIHVHGGGGRDVMEAEPSAMAAIETLLARHGVTSYCPTTVTAPLAKTLSALERLGRAVGETNPANGPVRARPLGIHLEGPFISAAKCGVHPAHDIMPPSLDIFDKFWNAANEHVRVMTLAPELPGVDALITEAAKRGVRVSLGHSNAESTITKTAIIAGATHATHTFNAMRALDHREPGILGIVLSDDRLTADIIADGIHVSPEMIKLFLAAKGGERAVLITDAISATGMPDGRYRLGTLEVEVSGGRCTAGGKLAGSVLTMDKAVRNVMNFAQWNLQQSLRLATLNPARVLGIAGRKGALAVGMDADMVVLNRKGEVVQTIAGGFGV